MNMQMQLTLIQDWQFGINVINPSVIKIISKSQRLKCKIISEIVKEEKLETENTTELVKLKMFILW